MNKDMLIDMIGRGMSSRDIAEEVGKSQTSISYWLKKFNLKTEPRYYKSSNGHLCRNCGETNPSSFYGHARSMCKKCFNEVQTEKFRDTRRAVVEMAGGRCSVCGYDKCIAALEFHHVDPTKKDPSYKSSKCWSLERILKEVECCVLLCSNCHREVESGITKLAE